MKHTDHTPFTLSRLSKSEGRLQALLGSATPKRIFLKYPFILMLCTLMNACSTVSHLPEGELLYTGTQYVHVVDDGTAPLRDKAVGEAKVAFASPPNNALFGSSRYRIPFPVGLWAYNAFVGDSTRLRRWLFKTFAATPILISAVNPEFRAEVAANTLRNYGYFDSSVSYHVDTLANGREASLGYTLRLGTPWYYHTVDYRPFTPEMDSLIHATASHCMLRAGEQFSYANIVGERNRLFTLFREHGYYYFRSDMLSLEADTLQQKGEVELRVGLQPSLPAYILKPWYIGDTHIRIEGGDTTRLPIRSQVLLPRIAFKRGDLYSSSAQNTTQRDLNRLGVFKSMGIDYVPRDSVTHTDTLDVYVNAWMEKPYELSLEANLTAKSNEQIGPGLVASLSRKNLLRMAETLQLRFKASYEWQIRRASRQDSDATNSFELGTDLSMSVPQLLLPAGHTYSYRWPVSTDARLYVDWLNRGGYFRMLAFGGNLTYNFSSSEQLTHNVSPFRLTFNTLEHTTHRFDSVMTANPAIGLSFRNQFVPALSYTITYDNTAVTKEKRQPAGYAEQRGVNEVNLPRRPRHPSRITLSVTSAGAITSGIYAVAGHPFGKHNKTLLGTPFAQFIKGSMEACRYYDLTPRQVLATRLVIGAVHAYGNSTVAPFSEQFYVGGANDLRAFPLRGVGPGSYHSTGRYAYIDHTGDLKLEANVEWRFPLAGQLHGALFVDAGNVWELRDDTTRSGSQFRWKSLGKDIALGTGIGLRYNLKVLVLRADVGIPLHIPYDTGNRGYYNVPHFMKGLCWHFAVGYPF